MPVVALGVTTVGNDVSVGGTLGVTGVTTLTGELITNGVITANGAVTLGDAYADNITVNGRIASSLWASSTLYIGSAGGGEDFVVTNNAITVGTTVNSSTLAVFGNTTLTGSLLPQANHNNLYDLGAYTKAWKDVFVSGTLYAGGLSLLGSERLAVTNVSSTNITAGGYLTTDGTTTLNGTVTLGDAATDFITATAYFRNTLSIGDGLSTTTTLTDESFVLGQAASFDVGKFYVDSSGNVSASGTLKIVGATTLNGNVTLGDAASDSITATGYFLSSITVGNGMAVTSTFGFDSIKLGSDATENLGKFYVGGNGAVTASGTIQTLQTTTSTIIIDTTDPFKGTCFVVKDAVGTRKYISIKADNTLLIGTVDCRLGTP